MAEYAMSIKNGNGLVFKTKADSLEEKGIDRGKKYLEYLVKHNIM